MALKMDSTFDREAGVLTFYARHTQTVEQVQCAYAIARDIPGICLVDFSDGERLYRIGDRAFVEVDAHRNVMLRQFDAPQFADAYWDLMVTMAADSWRGVSEADDASPC